MSSNIIIRDVKDNTLTLWVDGKLQEITNELSALRSLLEKQQKTSFQSADKIYNIEHITEANFGIVTGRKVFNQMLTRRLLEVISQYNEDAQRFLQSAERKSSKWERDGSISVTAREYIDNSFIGILRIQLRKLMAIGMEVLSDTKQRKYVEHCVLITNRILRFFCFVMISQLWDYKEQKECPLTDSQKNTLKNFFDDEFEMNISDNFRLFTTLIEIFGQHQLDFSIFELGTLRDSIHQDSEFYNSVQQMQHLMDKLNEDDYSLVDCADAEKHLCVVLSIFGFLAKYKMVSIKGLAYEGMHKSSKYFIHRYFPLELANISPPGMDNMSCESFPITTEAVLIYENHYIDGINLFPFLIDLNALMFENHSKVYFFNKHGNTSDSINFSFLEDSSVFRITFENTLKSMSGLNDIIVDDKKRKQHKLDTVYSQFQQARKIILS